MNSRSQNGLLLTDAKPVVVTELEVEIGVPHKPVNFGRARIDIELVGDPLVDLAFNRKAGALNPGAALIRLAVTVGIERQVDNLNLNVAVRLRTLVVLWVGFQNRIFGAAGLAP